MEWATPFLKKGFPPAELAAKLGISLPAAQRLSHAYRQIARTRLMGTILDYLEEHPFASEEDVMVELHEESNNFTPAWQAAQNVIRIRKKMKKRE
ncbi:MAG: hypothetical protein AAB634_03450 [Patescibacteria group bacterium]